MPQQQMFITLADGKTVPLTAVALSGGGYGISVGEVQTFITPPKVNQIGSERLTMAGAAQSATIPSGTDIVRIAAESGAIRWRFGATATSTSAGYLPQNAIEWIEIPSGATLSIYGASGAFANLVYGEFV